MDSADQCLESKAEGSHNGVSAQVSAILQRDGNHSLREVDIVGPAVLGFDAGIKGSGDFILLSSF
ncbi:MAG: hypothetical protein V2I36_11340 [Desulfopila sp.]|jgi:hypothetical protein|nr:hypothetical protein [Desulfopila sp.]